MQPAWFDSEKKRDELNWMMMLGEKKGRKKVTHHLRFCQIDEKLLEADPFVVW